MTDIPGSSSRPSSLLQKNSPGPGTGKRPSILLFLAAFLVLAAAFGCQKTDEGRLRGYLYLRLNNNPTTLDPALITDVQGGGIAAKLFNGLVRFNENLDI